MKKSISKIVAFISIIIISNVAFSQSIVVHTSDLKQTIDMMGGDMERSSKAIQNAKNTQEILDWSYGDIDFNICRVQYDKNQELVEGTKNWAFYDKQVATMQAIKAINPDIKFFATLRSDYDGYGDENNLPDWIINYNTKVMQREKYGIFLADYLEYMHKKGVTISIISTAKEWMWFVRAEKARDVIHKMNSELDARGVPRPQISDQGFWSLSAGITYLNDVVTYGTKDLYHSFCSHNYGNESNEKWVQIAELSKSLGKPIYDDETSTGSGSPTYGVERAMFKQITEYVKKANRYEAGLCGEVFFEIWSRGIDKETRAIYFPANGTGTRLRGYYLMKHFANNILDSRYVTSFIGSMPNVYTMQFRKEDKVVLWVINEGTTAYSNFVVGVDAFDIEGDVHVHYWNDSTSITGVEDTLPALGNRFETSMEGEAIHCYTFDVKDTPENLALNGTATQSSTQDTSIAQLAIDGVSNGVWAYGSVSLTQTEPQPWWQVNLGGNDTIGDIKIYKRTDECCKDVLSDFTVSVLDNDLNVVYIDTIFGTIDSCITLQTEGVIGQIVKIQSNQTIALALAEVQVFEGSIFHKLEQKITFGALGDVEYRKNPLVLNARAESGLEVSYQSSNTDVAEVTPEGLLLKSIGTTTITASIGESALYKAAPSVSRTMNVVKADQRISFPAFGLKKVGDPSFEPGATATSELEVTYTSSDTEVARVDNGRIFILAEGRSVITAAQAGNELYHATSSTQTLVVQKGDENQDTTQIVLTPTHDSFIRGGASSNDNYGTDVEVLVKQTDNKDFLRIAYLQFDLFDVDMVEKATLRLFAKTAKASVIAVSETTDNWTEGSLTYSNAPSIGATIASLAVNSAGKYYEWDVTNYVKKQMAVDDIASFAVSDKSSNKNNIGFYSKESATNKPQLVIVRKSVGNSQIQSNNKGPFNVYPNPATDILIVEANTQIQEINVCSILGEEVLRLSSVAKSHIRFSLADFSKGIYLVRVMDESGNFKTQKVLVQ